MENSYDYLFKIILIGDSGVGKTCLMKRYTENVYGENLSSTIGVDFKIKTIKINGKNAKLQIWDTAGQERFKSIVSNYYRGADGVFIVFDMLNKTSFENIQHWLKEFLQKNSTETAEIFLLGNKIDRIDEVVLTKSKILSFCRENNIKAENFIEVSAKTNLKVEDAFVNLTTNMIKRFGSKKVRRANKTALYSRNVGGGCC